MPTTHAAPILTADSKGWQQGHACVPFRHVLVCLDGSASAEAAVPLAAHLARMDDARVTVLRVLEAPQHGADLRPTDPIAWEIAREQARSYVGRIAERFEAAGVPAEARLAEGSAAREIAAVGAATSADLTVLSTHGEGGEDCSCVGRTAQRILDLAEGALLVVPSHPRKPASPLLPLRRLFVPLDGSLRAEFALPTALRLARAEGAEIVLAHVALDPIRTEMLFAEDDLVLARELADRLEARAGAYLERVRTRLSMTGPSARKALVRAADHRAGLVSLATREQPDLVVLSAHGSVCDTRRRFGSVTSYFIAHSPAPVLAELGKGPDGVGAVFRSVAI